MRHALILAFVLNVCWASQSFAQRSSVSLEQLDTAIDSITADLTTHLSRSKKMRVAVVDFVDANGDPVNLGSFLAEELGTKLFMSGHVDVIERRMLAKVLEEQKLEMSGLIDPGSIKRVGNILGIDALIVGTMSEFGQVIRFNVRALSVDTGLVMAAVSATVGASNTPSTGKTPGTSPQNLHSPGVIFEEDFSSYQEGDYPKGYGGLSITNSSTIGKNVLGASKDGDYQFEKKIAFPNDFRLSFRVRLKTDFAVFLHDSSGETDEVRISHAYFDGISALLPNGGWSRRKQSSGEWRTFQIVRIGTLLKVYLNGVLLASAQQENKKLYRGFTFSFTRDGRRAGNPSDVKQIWISNITLERMYGSSHAALAPQDSNASTLNFKEDFSSYRLGEYPEGYGGLKITKDPESKKNVLSLDGLKEGEFQKRIGLPDDFELSMDISLGVSSSGALEISIQDSQGDSDRFIFEQTNHFRATMPDGSFGKVATDRYDSRRSALIRIVREAGVYKVYRGTKFVASSPRASKAPSVGFTVRIRGGWQLISHIELSAPGKSRGAEQAHIDSLTPEQRRAKKSAETESLTNKTIAMAVKKSNVDRLHTGLVINKTPDDHQIILSPTKFTRIENLTFRLGSGKNQVVQVLPGQYRIVLNEKVASAPFTIDKKRANETYNGKQWDFIVVLGGGILSIGN